MGCPKIVLRSAFGSAVQAVHRAHRGPHDLGVYDLPAPAHFFVDVLRPDRQQFSGQRHHRSSRRENDETTGREHREAVEFPKQDGGQVSSG